MTGKLKNNKFLRYASISCIYILLSRTFLTLYIVNDSQFAKALITVITLLPPIILTYRIFGKEKPEQNKKSIFYSFVFIISAFCLCIGFNIIFSFFSIHNKSIQVNDIPLTILCIAVVPAVFEELLFRGCFINSGIVISSLMFGLIHSDMINALFAFLSGMILFSLCICTGRIWTSIIVHMLNNITAVLISAFSLSLNIFIAAVLTVTGAVGVFILMAKADKSHFKCEEFSFEPCFIAFLILAFFLIVV